MSLYLESHGSGPALVLIHGWGLHGGIWAALVEALRDRWRVISVDLPGHGRSAPLDGPYTLDAISSAVAAAVPDEAAWLGWSLGGRVALAAAARGQAITRLLLVGTTPRFIRGDDWPHAMPAAELQQFADALRDDWEGTLQRFLALQARGSQKARDELRALREGLFAHGAPQPQALAGGLDILRSADLRALLPAITQPALVVHGSRDTLAPPAAAEYLATTLPHGRLALIEGAGHAPFLSHPEAFLAALRGFLDE